MLLIDAFNLLHAARSAASALGTLDVPALAALIARAPPPPGTGGRKGGSGHDVLLVCDGTAGGLARRHREAEDNDRKQVASHGAHVRIVFAGPGKDADSYIERLLEEAHHARRSRRITVVSSDRRLQRAARGVGARSVPAEAFLILLVRVALPGGTPPAERPRPTFARALPLDPESVKWWTRFFELDEPGPAQPHTAPPTAARSRSPSKTSESAPVLPRLSPPRTSATPPPHDLDAVLRDALQTWAGRIALDDLDMAKWLTDKFPTDAKGEPHEEERLSGRASAGRAKKPRRR